MRATPAVAWGTKTLTSPSPSPAQKRSSSAVRSTMRSREVSMSSSMVCIRRPVCRSVPACAASFSRA